MLRKILKALLFLVGIVVLVIVLVLLARLTFSNYVLGIIGWAALSTLFSIARFRIVRKTDYTMFSGYMSRPWVYGRKRERELWAEAERRRLHERGRRR